MISMHHGERLLNALSKSNDLLLGKYVPMSCSNNLCQPFNDEDKLYVEQLKTKELHGTILPSFGEKCDYRHFKYLQAQFGQRIETNETFTIDRSMIENANDFCRALDASTEYVDNMAIMVHRGGCSFATKAQNIALTGAKMMMLINDEDNEISMGVESDYIASTIHLAAVMVSNSTGNELLKLLDEADASSDSLRITFHPISN